jgi:hypothetical protein
METFVLAWEDTCWEVMLNFLHSHLCDFLVASVRGLNAITGAIMIAPVIASVCFYFGEIWKEKLPRFPRVFSNAFMGESSWF